ncbi:MAG: tetrahydrofolate dehydrogenase/cyclohydrolase catalytic domain-containing protein [Patescibacteria group bacterium]|nr:tetrahydrofolate dehydrogenase/cyclohydrolase catalytic domain-containing protein [Patescibacteria group bacterium]
MKLIDGRAISKRLLAQVKKDIKKNQLKPGLAIILVGDDPASRLYVQIKEKASGKVGIRFEKLVFPAETPEARVIKTIKELNQRRNIHGIVVQLPLPDHINEQAVISAIDPGKDVDGFHPENVKKLLSGEGKIIPALVRSILALVASAKMPLAGKQAVVIANSQEFYDPIASWLKRFGVTSKFCPPAEVLKYANQADILIVAAGQPKLIDSSQVKPGSIVIDVGINQTDSGVVGDVDQKSLKDVEGFLTPVPGGVGPVTVASLLANTTQAAKEIQNRPAE